MATGKRFYWMKLKESFMTSDTIDYFMSQHDGANYVVLYQMLCLKTINTGGRFSRQIGEIIIPYDVEKIARDCKWFSTDTVRVALNLYKAFGLIYEDQDGVLVIADHENLVGSETDWAAKKQRQRLGGGENVPALVPADVPESVPIDIRDKEIEIRDREQRKEIKGLKEEPGANAPAPPPAPQGKATRKKSDPIFQAFAGNNADLLNALLDFAEMRKSIKKPLATDLAKQMLVNKLAQLSRDPAVQIAILNQSIFHGWQGVFELKDEGGGQRGTDQGHSGSKWGIKSALDD